MNHKPFKLTTEQVTGFKCTVEYYKTIASAEEAYKTYLSQQKHSAGNMSVSRVTILQRTGSKKSGTKTIGTWKTIKTLKGFRRQKQYC
jgi:hypothetical protein